MSYRSDKPSSWKFPSAPPRWIFTSTQALDSFLPPHTDTSTCTPKFLTELLCKAHPTSLFLHFPVADGTKHKEMSRKDVPGDRAQKRNVSTFSLCEEVEHLLRQQPQQSLLIMYIDEVSFRASSSAHQNSGITSTRYSKS